MDISKEKICVIVITYNPLQWIEKCLENVFNSSFKVEVLIIDNNSKDGFQGKIQEKLNRGDIHFIQLKSNIGFGQANNIGLKYAIKNKYDYVFLLNQDAYVQENTIETLIKVSVANPEYGILSPLHFNGQGSRIDLFFSIYINEIKCEGLISDFILEKNKNEVYRLPFVNAAAWLLPINTLKKVGGFDPVFFHYGEDDNYCQRVLFHGLKIGVVPDSKVYHDRTQVFKYPHLFHDLKTFDRMVKPILADINEDFVESFRKQKRELDAFIFYSIIDFKIRRVFKLLKFRSHLIKMKREIKNSIEINKKSGPNYLNESFDNHSGS